MNRSYDAAGLRALLKRLERAIADLEAQNEAGEEAAVARLPEKLADKEVLREQVRQTMADLASQKRHRRINLTDADARLMKGRQDIVAGYNAQAMVSPMATDGGATSMLVTAVDGVDAANDNALLVPMTLADAGYFAASHLVLQRRFKEECPGMYEGRLGAWHGSVWPVRCILASPPATAAAHSARTVPGAAFPAPPGRLGAG